MMSIYHFSNFNITQTNLSTVFGAEDTDMEDDVIIKNLIPQPDTDNDELDDKDTHRNHTDEESTPPFF